MWTCGKVVGWDEFRSVATAMSCCKRVWVFLVGTSIRIASIYISVGCVKSKREAIVLTPETKRWQWRARPT